MRDKDEQKRARILASVSTMMIHDGVASVSLSKIAKQAGIASGTMYTYFADKDDMLRQLYLDRNRQLADAITKIDETQQLDAQLNQFMDLTYQFGQQHLAAMQLIREFVQTPLLRSLQITASQMYQGYKPLEKMVQKGVAENIFERIDMHALLAFAYNPILDYLIALANGELTKESLTITDIKRLALKAILK